MLDNIVIIESIEGTVTIVKGLPEGWTWKQYRQEDPPVVTLQSLGYTWDCPICGQTNETHVHAKEAKNVVCYNCGYRFEAWVSKGEADEPKTKMR